MEKEEKTGQGKIAQQEKMQPTHDTSQQEWEVSDEWECQEGPVLELTEANISELKRTASEGNQEDILVDHHNVVRRKDLFGFPNDDSEW